MSFEFITPRLRIRPWTATDRSALARLTGDADMMRFISDGQPWSDDRLDELIARIDTHLEAHGVAFGALERRDDGEVLGLAGLQRLDGGDFELGWWVWKDFWGQGLAVEAARPFIDHAREVMGLGRLVAVIDEDNAASRRVAEKLGLMFECTKSARETMAIRPDSPIAFYAMDLSQTGSASRG